jgi:hypothetical protein
VSEGDVDDARCSPRGEPRFYVTLPVSPLSVPRCPRFKLCSARPLRSEPFTPPSAHTMMVGLCQQFSPWNFRDSCVREFWGSLLPVAFVALVCISYAPLPGGFIGASFVFIKAQTQQFLTLEEAEFLGADGDARDFPAVDEDARQYDLREAIPLWRTVLLSAISVFETLVWSSVGVFRLAADRRDVWHASLTALVAATWLYASARSILQPTATPPWDLFVLFSIHLATGVLLLGGVLYDSTVLGKPSPPSVVFVGLIAHVAAVVVLLGVILRMPFAIPNRRIRKEDIVRTYQALPVL